MANNNDKKDPKIKRKYIPYDGFCSHIIKEEEKDGKPLGIIELGLRKTSQ